MVDLASAERHRVNLLVVTVVDSVRSVSLNLPLVTVVDSDEGRVNLLVVTVVDSEIRLGERPSQLTYAQTGMSNIF